MLKKMQFNLICIAIGFFCSSVRAKNVINSCECGILDNSQDRIVGGSETKPNQFPWLVPILLGKKLSCGGAIINDRYILTAGHCVRWSNMTQMRVYTGAHVLKNVSPTQIYRVVQFLLHPKFYSHQLYDENDVAMLKLHKKIIFNEHVLPICLPKPEDPQPYDKYAIVAGWGRLGNNDKLSTVLLETFVKVLHPQNCRRTNMKSYITNDIFCAYTKNSDSCQGDSGGPLIMEKKPGKMIQIGIVSWGIGCATENSPGIYAKVYNYLDWIYQQTKDANYCRD